MKIFIICLLGFAWFSCGIDNSYKNIRGGRTIAVNDPEFLPQIQWIADVTGCGDQMSKIPVGFGDENDFVVDDTTQYKEIAYCLFTDEGVGLSIHVRSNWWNNTSDIKQKLVLAHEFGHCVSNLPHDNTLNIKLCPTSIMDFAISSYSWCWHDIDDIKDLVKQSCDPTKK